MYSYDRMEGNPRFKTNISSGFVHLLKYAIMLPEHILTIL